MTKHRFSTVRPLAVLALGLMLPFGAAPAASSVLRATVQRPADFIVVVVNSEPITNNEVRAKLLRTEQLLQQQGGALPARSELLPQLIERMVSDKAQLQAARAANLKIDDNAVEGAVQAVARQNQVTVDELRRRLNADGIDYAQFRTEIRDELLVSRLRQREVDPRAEVSDLEIDAYLRDSQSRPAVAGAATTALNLAEILVAVPENAAPEQVARLQARAQQVLERLRAGSDFAALAAEVSTSATRANGGQMGLRSTDRYPPLFVEATQNIRAGDLAGPVRSGAGFHILKVLEKRQAGSSLPDAVVTQTRARHILLRLTPQLSEAAAVEKLASFKKRIASGQADFAALARENSQDASAKADFAALARENSQDASAKAGGDLGWAPAGAFVPEVDKVMDALVPNQVSDPLVSRFGVHLVQVLERREVPVSARDQREMVRGMLREKKQNEALARWAEDIRGRAFVEFREPVQ